MRRSRRLLTGMVFGLIASVLLLVSCYPLTDTGTDEEASGSPWTGSLLMIGFIVLIFVMMYFFTIRPQRKRQQDQARMIEELRRGDKVVTIGGLYGTIENISEDSVIIRVESGTTMRFVKSAIASRVTEPQPQTGPKSS